VRFLDASASAGGGVNKARSLSDTSGACCGGRGGACRAVSMVSSTHAMYSCGPMPLMKDTKDGKVPLNPQAWHTCRPEVVFMYQEGRRSL